MSGKVGYVWHLRRLMAERDVRHHRAEAAAGRARGGLSREQVYRLVVRTPERLSLATLAALCDILGCGPGDLVEPVAGPARPRRCAADQPALLRPRRAEVLPGRSGRGGSRLRGGA